MSMLVGKSPGIIDGEARRVLRKQSKKGSQPVQWDGKWDERIIAISLSNIRESKYINLQGTSFRKITKGAE